MSMLNIDHAQTNLRWCNRAWADGELQDLALFLFRKALSQLVMEDMSLESQAEIVAAHLGREAAEDIYAMNEKLNNNPQALLGWQQRIGALIIC